ncbi:MAG: DUF1653 domain-containing protein [Solobacterium sp.]|jgi:hypothetical protein|nr:DUF1653 domain-containing protein [Solobacterium sp.]MCH4222368.1 DUF1653 domain-containing protein [Solobacterium sp.]MCH4265109.1 DUF1653 domain-containing protein [Solobacterium sp.]
MEQQEDSRIFKAGEIVKHFKRETADQSTPAYLYQIVGIAEDTESGNQLMIYRALYGEKGLFARPLQMFLSETDHAKYPEIVQKYRFEHVNPAELKNRNIF